MRAPRIPENASVQVANHERSTAFLKLCDADYEWWLERVVRCAQPLRAELTVRKWLIRIAVAILLAAAIIAVAYGTVYLMGYFDAR